MFERYYRELLNFLARKVGDRDLAADLAQESYARVYASKSAEVLEPRALLYTTARHLVTDHHRRSAVRAQVHADLPPNDGDDDTGSGPDAPGPESLEPDALLAGRQRLAAVERAVAQLAPRPREAFVLYKLDGLSRAEVAARMGVSVKTVETHLQIAMAACLRHLQALDAHSAPDTSASGIGRARASTRRRENHEP